MVSSTETGLVVSSKIVYFGNLLSKILLADLQISIKDLQTPPNFEEYVNAQTLISLPDVIIIEVDENAECFNQVALLKSNPILRSIIVILIGTKDSKVLRRKALALKVNDYYTYPFPLEDFYARINFLVKFKLIKPKLEEAPKEISASYKMPVLKRLFDVLMSGIALLMLSPLFLLVALLIKLGSKGDVIYKSKRVGAGYKIFDFYKFRSMRNDADKMLSQMQNLNQYANDGNKNGKSAFVKFTNDPRITKLGSFLRKTSIDELPQLINVLIGDMSLVGNRPLPLYEAEQLTTDKWAERFIGPAGLTGLWQISKRGQKDMSESERKELDNYYASNYSLLLDLKIILKTFPALIQKEQV
ncbi:MAG: sugar transferase [Pedobacter sp.]|uniref:sugar transferase n=1 Tax=Pedobacter agri TaxID=454586 RepID=UPI0012198860|nr:sugar transferase [Pedobacter agri]RZL63386.1 MAG: sugar transferase [Pedobacter sp.]